MGGDGYAHLFVVNVRTPTPLATWIVKPFSSIENDTRGGAVASRQVAQAKLFGPYRVLTIQNCWIYPDHVMIHGFMAIICFPKRHLVTAWP